MQSQKRADILARVKANVTGTWQHRIGNEPIPEGNRKQRRAAEAKARSAAERAKRDRKMHEDIKAATHWIK